MNKVLIFLTQINSTEDEYEEHYSYSAELCVIYVSLISMLSFLSDD